MYRLSSMLNIFRAKSDNRKSKSKVTGERSLPAVRVENQSNSLRYDDRFNGTANLYEHSYESIINKKKIRGVSVAESESTIVSSSDDGILDFSRESTVVSSSDNGVLDFSQPSVAFQQKSGSFEIQNVYYESVTINQQNGSRHFDEQGNSSYMNGPSQILNQRGQ